MNMISKIDHINISVSDLEKSKEFYINLLGFKLETEGDLEGDWMDRTVGLENVKAKYAKLIIPNSETSLELIQYYSPSGERDSKISQANQIGFRHMAFEVNGIENFYQKLKDAGVEIFSELQFYKIRKQLCYFLGPDGEILELAEYSEDK